MNNFLYLGNNYTFYEAAFARQNSCNAVWEIKTDTSASPRWRKPRVPAGHSVLPVQRLKEAAGEVHPARSAETTEGLDLSKVF